MTLKQYLTLTLAIFTLVGLMHALRLLYGWTVTFGTTTVPMWASWVAVIVALLLVISGKKVFGRL